MGPFEDHFSLIHIIAVCSCCRSLAFFLCCLKPVPFMWVAPLAISFSIFLNIKYLVRKFVTSNHLYSPSSMSSSSGAGNKYGTIASMWNHICSAHWSIGSPTLCAGRNRHCTVHLTSWWFLGSWSVQVLTKHWCRVSTSMIHYVSGPLVRTTHPRFRGQLRRIYFCRLYSLRALVRTFLALYTDIASLSNCRLIAFLLISILA